MTPKAPRLQAATLMAGRGRAHHAYAADPPLSLKCMLNCRARYRVGGSDFIVDDGGYLILNAHQPYEIAIGASKARGAAESFIIWFPSGWAEEVGRTCDRSAGAMLDEPATTSARQRFFLERYTPHDDRVSPMVRMLCAVHARGDADDLWLEEQLRELLARMWAAQSARKCELAQFDAVRAYTREELWRRVNRARDFIHANSTCPLTLTEVARACALSPFHLLRTFRAAFGLTPHAWLARCRLAHAQTLLAHTTEPVTEICAHVGFESLGSFSAWFGRTCGVSPRAWRRAHGRRAAIRNIREVQPSIVVVGSTQRE